MVHRSSKKRATMQGAILFFALLVCACGPPVEEFPLCTEEADCAGLIPCVSGRCVPECTEDAPCVGDEESCVFGGCTPLPFEGPFFVRTGPNSTANEGESVLLNGNETIYVGASVLDGQWLQVDGPPVTLKTEGFLQESFEVPKVLQDEVLTFRLVVFDASASASADRTVSVLDTINETPVAKVSISPGPSVVEFKNVVLDASSSFDPNPNDTISFSWYQPPIGPQVTLNDLNSGAPNQRVQFSAPEVSGNTDVFFRLRVEDSRGGSDEIEIEIQIRQIETLTCSSVSDCLSDAPCTTVECVAGLCLDSVLSWCCAGGRSCDDGDPCTQDVCDSVTGCTHELLSGCCREDLDCSSPGGCWEGVCAEEDGLCSFGWIEGCCESASDCALSGPCAQAICHDGQCLELPIDGCCDLDAECDDGALCTVDYCDPLTKECRFEPLHDCCEADEDCLTPSVCLQNACEAETNTCSHKALEGSCCVKNEDCDDGDPCTNELCDLESGVCFLTPIEGCCNGHEQCPDAGSCTVGLCVEQSCTVVNIPECCDGTDTSACDDGVPCTDDFCVPESASCVHHLRPSCCNDHSDCDDGQNCTVNLCDLVTGTCQVLPVSACCSETSDCNDDNPCTSETCENGACVSQVVPGCCASNTVCDDGNECTVDQCDPVTATCEFDVKESCCNVDEDCSALSEPCRPSYCFVPENTCVTDPDPDCCAIDGNCAMAGPCVLRMCVEDSCINNDLPFCCVDESDCDDGNLCTFDECIELTGECEHTAEVNCCRRDADCPSSNDCQIPQCDTATGNCGFVSDPDCCTVDSDCDDGDPCTADGCTDGQCQHVPGENCCNGDAYCTPANACESPTCTSFVCTGEPVAGCCLSDTDCVSENPCLAGLCDLRSHQCLFLSDPLCCELDAQCDDNDPCTDDQCVTGSCSNDLVTGPCCAQNTMCTSSDTCSAPVCSAESFTCGTAPIFGCCAEDQDCNPSSNCGPVYCSGLNANCVDSEALCCASDVDCDTQTECQEDLCVQGKCLSRNTCCTTNSECDDGNPCTADVCTQEGQCSFSPANAGLACDDSNTNSVGDFCDAQGRCQGFHTTIPPLNMTDTQIRAVDSRRLLGVGESESGGSTTSMVVLSVLGTHPNHWQTLPDEPFVSVEDGYALSQSGAVWKLMEAGTLSPQKNDVLTTVLSGLGVSGWHALTVRKDLSGVVVELLAGGSSDILARCGRTGEEDPWLCAGEDIGAFVGVEFLTNGWSGAPDYWVGSLGTDGNVFLLGDSNGWTVAQPMGCGLADELCAMDTLTSLKSWPQVELAVALGSPGAILRWSPALGWESQGPPAGVVGPSLSQLEFRDAARDGELLLTVGYEQSCAIAATDENCPIFVGRWWMWPALITPESLNWLAPILLHESWCGSAQGYNCLPYSQLGPSGLSRDSTTSRWMLSGGTQEPSGIQRSLLFWRP